MNDPVFERQVIDRLARIEEKLTPLGALPQRVDSLERWRAYLVGIAATVGSIVTLLGTRIVAGLWRDG